MKKSSKVQKNTSQNVPSNKTPKKRKKISAKYLENAGAYYLGRYASSRENFRRVMMRKIDKSCKDNPDQSYEKCCYLLNQTIEKFDRLGYLDDEKYALSQYRQMRLKGKSFLFICQKLKEKGVPSEIIETMCHNDTESPAHDQETEYKTALRLCQKKRIGAFRRHESRQPADQADIYRKELARLARAGFSYDVAKKALDTPREKAEEFISQLQQNLYSG